MRTKLLTLGLAALGLAALTGSASAQLLINKTATTWRFNQSATPLDGTGWQNVGYDDTQAGWEGGRGVFAFENNAVVNPLTNTALYLTYPGQGSQTLTYYFRAHFNVAGDPSTLVLTSSNLIDDGMVIWINGVEVDRYNFTGTADSYSALAAAANPAGEGVYVTRQIASPNLVVGDNLIAVEVKQNSATSSDIVFGMDLHAITAFAPVITAHPVSTNVLEGRSATLSVTANAAPAPTYQWYKDFSQIPDATNASYTITDMTIDKAGSYHVNVSNPYGAVDSAPASVGFIEDEAAPVLISAAGDPLNLQQLFLNFDESITGALDTFYYAIDLMSGGIGPSVTGVAYNSTSNQLTLSLDSPLDPTQAYKVTINSDGVVQDYFGNGVPNGTEKRITFPAVFRQGLNGYASTHDTELSQDAPDANKGTAEIITVDTVDPQNDHGLVRFDNIVGGGPGQIPFGSPVTRAILRIWTDNNGSSPTRMMRMLVPWDEATATWNSMINGLDETNGTEAVAFTTFSVSTDDQFDDIDVTALVQEWVNGTSPNYGWGFIPIGDDGWRWATSENASENLRPTLTVEFVVEENPCSIITQPQGTTVNEGAGFELSVLAAGSDLSFQWFRNNVAIPGATASSYSVASASPTADSGTYRVEVSGSIPPSPCISANAIVTVNPDVTRPTLVSAVGNPDQTTITLVFSERLSTATAQNTGNYSLGGLAINSAVLSTNGTMVTLTTAPRVVGNNYTLTITGVRDASAAGNLIDPNPTSLALRQRVRIFGYADTWKYDETGTDLGTAWKETSFNDSAWLSGQGLFGLETTAGTITSLNAQGVNTNTAWTVASGKITYYVRKAIDWNFNPAGTTFTLNHFTDDGFILYVNGVEGSRFNMTNSQPVLFTDQAVSAAGEGVLRSTNVTGISCGPNLIAVEIHQNGTASTDVIFGGELIAEVTSFGPCPTVNRVSIVRNENGTVTISWTGGGTLVESTTVNGTYSPSANQANPQTFTPTGTKFYQSRN